MTCQCGSPACGGACNRTLPKRQSYAERAASNCKSSIQFPSMPSMQVDDFPSHMCVCIQGDCGTVFYKTLPYPVALALISCQQAEMLKLEPKLIENPAPSEPADFSFIFKC